MFSLSHQIHTRHVSLGIRLVSRSFPQELGSLCLAGLVGPGNAKTGLLSRQNDWFQGADMDIAGIPTVGRLEGSRQTLNHLVIASPLFFFCLGASGLCSFRSISDWFTPLTYFLFTLNVPRLGLGLFFGRSVSELSIYLSK